MVATNVPQKKTAFVTIQTHPYVFVYGIGKMYPYMRSNEFLTAYEEFNDTSKYKIILFYPGHREGNSFVLFDTLHDQHSYRAILLVNE